MSADMNTSADVSTNDASRARGVTRWLNPAGFVLAGIMLFLPFMAVSCDAPGGFGHAAPGGTTTYTGITFVTGQAPSVTPPDKVRPKDQQRDDKLGAQPLAIALALLIVGGLAAAVAVRQPFVRRATTTVIAAVGWLRLRRQR